jgi:hypothetical protein
MIESGETGEMIGMGHETWHARIRESWCTGVSTLPPVYISN